jgi:hypothetical protein
MIGTDDDNYCCDSFVKKWDWVKNVTTMGHNDEMRTLYTQIEVLEDAEERNANANSSNRSQAST